MGHARFLGLVLPVAALLELALFVHDAESAPRLREWQALRGQIERLKGARDLVVAAPEWADPLARAAFGDRLLPIADLARADASAYDRAIEVSELGAELGEFQSWPVRQVLTVGRFELRVHDNPAPAKVLFSFLDQARPPFLTVAEELPGEERACPFTTHAAPSAGGLHGHLAFPRERYGCGGENFFVGVTILDDQEYRPRRCLWAETHAGGTLGLSFKNVPLGRRIHGYAGSSYFIFRDGTRGPVTLSAQISGVEVGRYAQHDEWGWHGFDFDTARFAGQSADVEFRVHSDDSSDRQFCFYADSR
jgi:hypothetical protein